MNFLAEKGLETGGSGKELDQLCLVRGQLVSMGLQILMIYQKKYTMNSTKWHDVNLPHKFKIAVGGCPNNCVKPNLNDLGVIGLEFQL